MICIFLISEQYDERFRYLQVTIMEIPIVLHKTMLFGSGPAEFVFKRVYNKVSLICWNQLICSFTTIATI